MKLSDLWRWEGELSRGPFALWGALLFAIKYNLDRLILRLCYDIDWSIFSYLQLGTNSPVKSWGIERDSQLLLLAIALPFLVSGVALTLRRLRSLHWPLWLVVLFVVPVIKYYFFVALLLVPGKRTEPPLLNGVREPGWLGRMVPHGKLGSATFGVGASLLLALGATVLSTTVLEQYGLGLFVGMPFAMGLISVLVYAERELRSPGECIGVAVLSAGIAAVAMLVLAFEGIICLVMAAPLAGIMAIFGGGVGYVIQAQRWQRSTPVICAAFLTVPLLIGAEYWEQRPAPLLSVTSSVEINASPARVWRQVVSFAELPPPQEWLFRCGVAYPIRAEIRGRGVGALRHCVFSTGPFVEPIEVWDEPHLLKFSVTRNPEPMQEWTPYREIHPPHLRGFLESKGGQFRLIELPNGRTRLEGTTWYHHHMWPVDYWQTWSDFIIHRIHLRVLNHVQQLAEADLSTEKVCSRF